MDRWYWGYFWNTIVKVHGNDPFLKVFFTSNDFRLGEALRLNAPLRLQKILQKIEEGKESEPSKEPQVEYSPDDLPYLQLHREWRAMTYYWHLTEPEEIEQKICGNCGHKLLKYGSCYRCSYPACSRLLGHSKKSAIAIGNFVSSLRSEPIESDLLWNHLWGQGIMKPDFRGKVAGIWLHHDNVWRLRFEKHPGVYQVTDFIKR